MTIANESRGMRALHAAQQAVRDEKINRAFSMIEDTFLWAGLSYVCEIESELHYTLADIAVRLLMIAAGGDAVFNGVNARLQSAEPESLLETREKVQLLHRLLADVGLDYVLIKHVDGDDDVCYRHSGHFSDGSGIGMLQQFVGDEISWGHF